MGRFGLKVGWRTAIMLSRARELRKAVGVGGGRGGEGEGEEKFVAKLR